MTEPNTTEQHIWNPETGITDIEGDVAKLSASEIPGIKDAWATRQQHLKDSGSAGEDLLSTFTERLSREWSIETGAIENLYQIDRGVTRTLIEHGLDVRLIPHGTTNKSPEYIIQLAKDHEATLQGIFDFVKGNRKISTSYIKQLHVEMVRSQETVEAVDGQGHPVEIPLAKGEWKQRENHPNREGVVYKYCSVEQTASEMDRLIEIHEKHIKQKVPSEAQAAWLHHRFTQIHPFQDGNGRVARALASLILIKDGLFPLVVTRDNQPEYIAALEAADTGELKPLVDVIVKLQMIQFQKASTISETLISEKSTTEMLTRLQEVASVISEEKRESFKDVSDFMKPIEDDLENRLDEIASEVRSALQRIDKEATTSNVRSDRDDILHLKAQIVFNEKKHFDYVSNSKGHFSWVALEMKWSHHTGYIIFSFHGAGDPFDGSLICTPFLMLQDDYAKEQTDRSPMPNISLVPTSEEGFIFFYNENHERLIDRFRPWREKAIQTALQELTRNL